MDPIIQYLMLTLMNDIGPVSANCILEKCGGIEESFRMPEDELIQRTCTDTGDPTIALWRARSFIMQRQDKDLYKKASEIIKASAEKHISIITRDDTEYPSRFHGLSDMPVVLFIKGNLTINTYKETIGIVGARRCTPDGKQNAVTLASTAADAGITVISGMAKGIDSYAHTAALKADGYTIAVLGNGPDICYPKEHIKLYELIAEKGCILSEQPPGIKPKPYMFPSRNRLIAALSDTLYVLDAGRISGTETTVAAAEKYGRSIVQKNEVLMDNEL